MTRRRPAKIITRVIVFLLLGAIVNVGVATACAYWTTYFELLPSENARQALPDESQWFARHGPKLQSNEILMVDAFAAHGFKRIEYYDAPDWWGKPGYGIGGGGLEAIVAVTLAGWPLYSLHGEQHRDHVLFERRSIGDRVDDIYSYHWSIRVMAEEDIGGPVNLPRPLPIRPTILGFPFNTIFYAAILGLLFFAPGSVRRAFRRRRGLCPACAYRVGTSPVCTECGKPVTNRNAETQKAEIT